MIQVFPGTVEHSGGTLSPPPEEPCCLMATVAQRSLSILKKARGPGLQSQWGHMSKKTSKLRHEPRTTATGRRTRRRRVLT